MLDKFSRINYSTMLSLIILSICSFTTYLSSDTESPVILLSNTHGKILK